MRKGIPQALNVFIEVAKGMCEKILSKNTQESKLAAFEMKLKSFGMFL